jgi:hypothetical protein
MNAGSCFVLGQPAETRHRLRLPLRCPVIFASDEFIGEGTIVDLGVPGCAVESDIAPLPGDYSRASCPHTGRTRTA